MATSGGNDGGSYAATLQELAAAFTELKRDRGAPSYDRILVRGKKVCGERHAMSKASVSEVFAGRRGPASLDRLLWLVRVLLSYDDGEEVKPPERRDPELQVWRDRWHTLERARAAARRALSTGDAERVLASDPDSAAATSLVEGIEPDDTFLRSGRHQRPSTFDLLNELPASATQPVGEDNAAAASRGAPPPPDSSLATPSSLSLADEPQPTMVGLPPRLAQAFSAPEVRVDAACLTAETLMLALAEPLRLIHEGRIRPQSIDVRILLPSRQINLAFPVSVKSPRDTSVRSLDGDPVHQRWLELRNVQGQVLRHNLVALRSTHGIDARVTFRALPFTPPMKLYLLNGTEALMGYYMIAKRREEVEGQTLETYDTLGAASLLFSYVRQAGRREAVFVDQSQMWFDALWETITTDLSLS
ncbi:hypothetical protein M2163_000962 [Streptomyces sp. SAI-135]|nr:hypothetical protein [Streptomyces sp. SAI-090]MDH6573413.1 hypothetical protein [Streptomyces sp. SAI-117]MDH6581833.1 hypothetical protein [Streptomyces sp. SAI-133]MDH6590105.1 hypothetical protein [Streptomyces sp. SAI-133]MDH6613854.1 hypothetical protein [Streptomyces sp. SAI-135]